MTTRFLIARMFYTDGLNTIFAFGGVYAAGTFHFNLNDVVILGIALNIAAGVGAICLAWVDDFVGSRFTVYLSLISIIICTAVVVFTHSVMVFWIFCILLSLNVGPVQAASRSLMVRLSPKEYITQMFGLYSLTGKATSFLGPWIVGWFTYKFATQRAGIATILFFLIVGGVLLLWVKEPAKHA